MGPAREESGKQSGHEFLIYLDANGDFPCANEKQYTVHAHDTVSLILDSSKIQENQPLLLTNFPSLSKKAKAGMTHPQAPEFNGDSISEATLLKNYKVFPGSYNEEGSWKVDLHIEDFDGSLFLQVIFVSDEYLPGQIVPLKVTSFGAAEWMVIQPRIQINGKAIGMDELIIQTVLPYSLGDCWIDVLRPQTQLGYNAFHFPPVQQLGASGSYYSIKDQLKINQDLFKGKVTLKEAMGPIVQKLEKEHNSLSFIDILLNHTSFDSPWLCESNNSVYCVENSPHLQVALELDCAIQQFSDDLALGKVKAYRGGSNRIQNDEQLNELMIVMQEEVFEAHNFAEYFLFDISTITELYKKTLTKNNIEIIYEEAKVEEDENIFSRSGFDMLNIFVTENTQFIGCSRFGVKICIEDLVDKVIKPNPRYFSVEALQRVLSNQNSKWRATCDSFIEEALISTKGQIKYRYITEGKSSEVTLNQKLVSQYFTKLANGTYAANNGWITDYDPMNNFAEDKQFHYFRRTISIWGDLVKLRYGQSKQDSPSLWSRMKQYVQSLARIFHGFRLDNAHSTPLVVGEYFMRKARNVNQNLMIFAELFTGSGIKDAVFCKRIGINALVRELNQSRNDLDLYHCVHRYSRSTEISVGSLPLLNVTNIISGASQQILVPSNIKCVVYDQTHDNQSPLETFSHKHMLSIIALSSFGHYIQGTVRGFDELYPKQLSVVNERRLYKDVVDCTSIESTLDCIEICIKLELDKAPIEGVSVRGSWDEWSEGTELQLLDKPASSVTFSYLARLSVPTADTVYEYKFIVDGTWIADSKKATRNGNNFIEVASTTNKREEFSNLSHVRQRFLAINQTLNSQFPFIFYSHYDFGFLSVMRETPDKNSFYFLITRTDLNHSDSTVNISIECPGIISQIEGIYSASDELEEGEDQSERLSGKRGQFFIEYNILKYGEISYNEKSKKHVISLWYAPPSLSIVIKCTLHSKQLQGIERLNYMLAHIQNEEILALYKPLRVDDINFLFFSSDHEEIERGNGIFHIPNQGNLLFGGLAGVFTDVNQACRSNDLGAAIFESLRQGNWYLDYAVARLKKFGGRLERVKDYIESYFELLKAIPRYLIPHYFSKFIANIKLHANKAIFSRLKGKARNLTSEFHRNLCLANYQFLSSLPSTKFNEYSLSMAAGLPHFTTGWSRCWGRDTFISFRGGLLITGLFEEGLSIICMFASTLRHGLIPNLLDSGKNPRYNCRDGCWWFVKAIRDYIDFIGDASILKKEIKMRFLSDDYLENLALEKAGAKSRILTLEQIVYEIFASHAKGIIFREWKAGWEIDSNIDTEGFNIKLKLDESTGFIFGGSHRNCLTWMDKMGSSAKAGNKGIPATARDGAPIEMTALLKVCVDFAANCIEFKKKEVETSSGRKLTFKQWSSLIVTNFERYYWIPSKLSSMENMNSPLTKYVQRKGIYKDLYLSSNPRCDYQLRPNAHIAIALAPELFTPMNALLHLATVEACLIEKNSLGVKTLDKLGAEYVQYYNNSDDGIQPKTAHGFSYHNGPEWVWVYGYYVKALIEMNKIMPMRSRHKIMSYLANHKQFIKQSPWISLPEMTNQNGEYCQFSCPSQAWSVATLVEVCYDIIDNTRKPSK